MQNDVETLRKCHHGLVEAQLQQVEATSDVEFIQNRNREVEALLNERNQEIKQLQEQSQRTKRQLEEKRNAYAEVAADISEEEIDIHVELENQPDMDEGKLNDEIASLVAQIGLLHEGNPGFIRQYEQRIKDIERYRVALGDLTINLEMTKERIRSVREEWEPQLDALIGKISDAFAHNFSKIGCAGEVGIYKADDFKEWAVQIRVKFRSVLRHLWVMTRLGHLLLTFLTF
jgi:structural maintenance of chromosomes protein 5